MNTDTKIKFQAILGKGFRWAVLPLDATEQHPAVWIAILGGAGLGCLWGIAARIWMRLISTAPEFSVSGTVAILVISTLFGTFAGFAFVARRRGWRRWKHYVPRGLAVTFFIPFGAFGGMPLMLTVLLATLGLVQRAMVGVWVFTALTLIAVYGTDFDVPEITVGIAWAGAVAVTVWKWLARSWHNKPRLMRVDAWLERIVRTLFILLALAGFGYIARDVITDTPGWAGPLYVILYLILLYPLFLGLRIGLKPVVLPEGRAVMYNPP